MSTNRPVIKEILPKQGLVYSEKNTLTELLCKPKIMPIKSLTLEKLEQMQKEANAPVGTTDFSSNTPDTSYQV